MSEKKWRSERLQHAPWCDVCGAMLGSESATKEHLPPKVLFNRRDREKIKFRLTLSCKRCNHSTSQIDQFIGWVGNSNWAAFTDDSAALSYAIELQRAILNNDPQALSNIAFNPFGIEQSTGPRAIGLDVHAFRERVLPFQAKISAAYFSSLLGRWELSDRLVSLHQQLSPFHFDNDSFEAILDLLPDGLTIEVKGEDSHPGFSARWGINERDRYGVICFSIFRTLYLVSFILPPELVDGKEIALAVFAPDTGMRIWSRAS